MNDRLKKIFTILLTVFFIFAFSLVCIGTCGGIRYLRDNKSDNIVYADSVTTEVYTSSLAVPVQLYYDYVSYYDPIDDDDVELVYGSVFMPFIFLQTNDSLILRCAYSTNASSIDRYIDVNLYAGSNIAYNVLSNERELRSIAFLMTASQRFDVTNGKLLGVYVNIPSGDAYSDDPLPFTFTCIFETGIKIILEFVPNRYELYDDGYYSINRLYNFSGLYYYQMPGHNLDVDVILHEGYLNGFDEGFYVGYREGKNDGIIEGASTANDYSFLGLLTAVFDAPIKAFTGLLSFELFGFDMAILYKSLFAVSIIILLLRLFI